MSQIEKANQFLALHEPGFPIVLYNIWDAGSAKAVEKAGAKAIATGSHSVAEAQGYNDGEAIPLELLLTIARRIVETTDLPVTIDFEGAYAVEPDGVASNVAAMVATGAVGINFEDQIVGGEGLHSIEDQFFRIKAAREGAGDIPFFINARTDLFLKSKPEDHASLIPEAMERAAAFADAGASGFFVPGLTTPDLIGPLCEAVSLPVNIMARGAIKSPSIAGELGAARLSYGPTPFVDAMATLTEVAQT